MVEKNISVKEMRQAAMTSCLSEELVMQHLTTYMKDKFKGDTSRWTETIQNTTINLAVNFFTPALIKGRDMDEFKINPQRREEYDSILAGCEPRDRNTVRNVSIAVSRRIYKTLLQSTKPTTQPPYIVGGDPLLTKRMGDMRSGATAPNDNSHFGLYDQAIYQSDHMD